MNAKLFQSTFILVTLLALFIAQLPSTIVLSYFVGIFLLFRFEQLHFKRKYIELYFVVAFILFVPTLTFNHGITPLFYFISSPFLFWTAYQFSKNSLSHVELVLRNTYWFFVFFIFVGLVFHWGDPEPLGAILPWASTNGIPSYLIVLQVAYSLSYYLKYNRFPILSGLITLLVAIFGLGRGSMIVAGAIIFFSLFINIILASSANGRSLDFKVFVALIVPIVFVLIDNIDNISSVIEVWIEGSKFSGGVLDEHRGRMLMDYINKIDAPELLLGTSYENTSINDIYGGNPHNSYIRVHSFYGVFGLLLVFVPLIAIISSRKKLFQKCVFILFISLALLRAISEPIFFPSTLDFFYFLYFLIFFRYSKDLVKKERQNDSINTI